MHCICHTHGITSGKNSHQFSLFWPTYFRCVSFGERYAAAVGKLFYHITSTQAAQGGPADRQRLKEGLEMMLTALAYRLQRWLERKTEEQRQRLRDQVRLQRQQRQKRQQQRLLEAAEGRGHVSTQGPHLPGQAASTTGMSPSSAAAGTFASIGSAASSMQQLSGVAPVVVGGTAGSMVPQVVSTGSASRQADTAGAGSTGRGSLACSDDVQMLLKDYAIFHNSWQSSRQAPYSPSPGYDGALLTEVVSELFGFCPRGHGD